jgi:hypothetical protein
VSDAQTPTPRPFRVTLVRVLVVEIVVLTLLWLLQRRYTP